MSSHHISEALMVSPDCLIVPSVDGYTAKSSKVDDEILRNSVELTGIQQPLIVIRADEERFYVVDGVRRLNVCRDLGLKEVPCVVDHGADDVTDTDEYRNRIRFILDEHRQDLLPTQRAQLIARLQETFDMNSRDVGLYLGVTSGTISNWKLIEKVIPEMQHAIDDGVMKIHSARAFASMTEEGQRTVWDEHRDAVLGMSGGRLHKWVRNEYPPQDHREMYVDPDKIITQLKRKESARKGKKRRSIKADKSSAHLKEFEAKTMEIEDKKKQITAYEEDINASIKVIEAVIGDEELWELVPEGMQKEFEEFAERNIA